MTTSTDSYSAFFYGTLMHPKVLQRVIGLDSRHLQIAPAVLLNHTRHKVKQQDYPGVVSYQIAQSEKLVGELERDQRCVRGCLVAGLTERDILFLDVFEGSEYRRTKIQAYPLEPLVDMSIYSKKDEASLTPVDPPPIPAPSALPPPVEAETYIYLDPSALEHELWSFEEFVKQNASKWYGADARAREDIVEVDRLRAEILAAQA
ncbi:hypothetical protein V5O48_010438 [Marasmius crinis-equi]|uniref:Putative gamma-glutamylcyclotransferase n=1 Tax=Marasmius crinis-equi TaxID=585013 RepID=A0ABR3F8B9_9AGAR